MQRLVIIALFTLCDCIALIFEITTDYVCEFRMKDFLLGNKQKIWFNSSELTAANYLFSSFVWNIQISALILMTENVAASTKIAILIQSTLQILLLFIFNSIRVHKFLSIPDILSCFSLFPAMCSESKPNISSKQDYDDEDCKKWDYH